MSQEIPIDTEANVKPSPPAEHKPALATEALRDAIDLSLWAGQMLLEDGATSRRIEETVHHVGTGLGCDWLDILVSPGALIITASSGPEFRTKMRRVTHIGVDLGRVTAVSRLSRRIDAGQLDRFQVRAEMERISRMPHYNRWLVMGMAGLACASFSRLFGGDWPVFGLTLGATATAMWVRQELIRRFFNPLLVVITAAFTASLIAGSGIALQFSPQPEIALTAAVLFLIPGVPLISAAQDLIRGNIVIGLARGMSGLLITLAIAVGLLLAVWVLGVPIYG